MILVINIAQAAKCKPFVCKSFSAGTNDVCVLVDSKESSNQLVRKCDTDKVCSANGWSKVEQATANATCIKVEPTPEIKNQTLPGDKCSKTTECFGLANETECSTVCKTKRGENQFCINTGTGSDTILGTKWCDVGLYCDTKNKKCVKQLDIGATCTAAEQCPTNSACIKVNSNANFVCTKYWSLAEGDKFDSTMMRQAGFFLSTKDACASHHTITPNQATPLVFECRKATTGNYTKEEQLKRANGPSNDCGYTKYEDATDKTKAQIGADTAICGFNKDGSAYCNKRKGDSWFQDVFKKMKDINTAGLKCHALSSLTTCGAAQTTVGDKLMKEWTRELLATDEYGYGWSLYASNDNCVASSMTGSYWQGDSPDFAFGSFSTTSFATVVLTICALFYMF